LRLGVESKPKGGKNVKGGVHSKASQLKCAGMRGGKRNDS